MPTWEHTSKRQDTLLILEEGYCHVIGVTTDGGFYW